MIVKPCPVCKGSGKGEITFAIEVNSKGEGKFVPLYKPCLECQGTGSVPLGDKDYEA